MHDTLGGASSVVGVERAASALLGYVGRQPGTPARPSDSWRTPQRYIDSARKVMGSIDLDPFSSLDANTAVRATFFFTPATSALERRWCPTSRRRRFPHGMNVWMNPPYSAQMIGEVTCAFRRAWDLGDIQQAVVLLNNATETRWFPGYPRLSHCGLFSHRAYCLCGPGRRRDAWQYTRTGLFLLWDRRWQYALRRGVRAYGWVIHREHGWRA